MKTSCFQLLGRMRLVLNSVTIGSVIMTSFTYYDVILWIEFLRFGNLVAFSGTKRIRPMVCSKCIIAYKHMVAAYKLTLDWLIARWWILGKNTKTRYNWFQTLGSYTTEVMDSEIHFDKLAMIFTSIINGFQLSVEGAYLSQFS